MDVLEFSGNYSGDDVVHLLRYSEVESDQQEGTGPKFRGFSLLQLWAGADASGNRARRKARLVALGSLQRAVHFRLVFSALRTSPATPRSQSAGGHALSSAVEHHFAGNGIILFSVFFGDHNYPRTAIARHSRI